MRTCLVAAFEGQIRDIESFLEHPHNFLFRETILPLKYPPQPLLSQTTSEGNVHDLPTEIIFT